MKIEANSSNLAILSDYQLETCIMDIINDSTKYCFIVTPFFNKNEYWENLTRTLKNASYDKKRILFIFNPNTDQKEGVIKELNGEYGFDLYFIENLHSKIYLNENQVLITSMNLTNFSRNNDHEIGCLINDPAISQKVVNEIILKKILQNDKKEYINGMWSDWLDEGRFLDETIGYCIDCKSPIPYNSSNPFCKKCCDKEKHEIECSKKMFCHGCGNAYKNISPETPLCYICYSKENNKSKTST